MCISSVELKFKGVEFRGKGLGGCAKRQVAGTSYPPHWSSSWWSVMSPKRRDIVERVGDCVCTQSVDLSVSVCVYTHVHVHSAYIQTHARIINKR